MCSSLSMESPSISQYDAVGTIKSRIVRGDDLRSGGKPTQDFELLAGTPADPDAGPLRRLAVFRQDEDPVTTGAIQEGPDGKDARLRIAPQLQAPLGGLTGHEVRWTLAGEIKVDGELSVFDLRQYPVHGCIQLRPIHVHARGLSDVGARG